MDPVLAMEQEILSNQEPLRKALQAGDSEVQRFYEGMTIFVTGGTGFLGKQLIEKLLRACWNLKKIYVLIRSKKGKDPKERLQVMLEDPLYSELRKVRPYFNEQVDYMEGDVTNLQLGLSERDKNIFAEEVNVIFHSAATVRFDEPLKKAVLINVRGTREVFSLAATCKYLRSMVHVSTAFCNCPWKTIEEKFYPSPIPYDVLIDLVENSNENILNNITQGLLDVWPNTYTYTKAIAESVAKEMSSNMPVSVFRPAVVVAAYREPSPGWIDMSSVYGATGLIIGIGLGVMRALIAEPKYQADLVPVDYVNNSLITTAWATARDSNTWKEPKIFSYGSAKWNKITWGELRYILENNCTWMASPVAVWYCTTTVCNNRFAFNILAFLFHTIPSYIIDGIGFLMGKNLNMRYIYQKMNKLTRVMSFFNLTYWNFEENNCLELFRGLSEKDRTIFFSDITNVDWKEYMQIWVIGVRKYIVKDELANTESGVRKQFWLRFLHYFVLSLYCYTFYKLITWFIFILMFIYSIFV